MFQFRNQQPSVAREIRIHPKIAAQQLQPQTSDQKNEIDWR